VISLVAGFSPSGIVSLLSFHKHHIQKEEKFMSKSDPVKGKNSKQAKAEKGLSRRKFLASAALAAGGAAATVGFPSVVKAQGPISMRWQSTWPTKDIFHEYALDFAKKVNDMTGGDLKIEVLPAGAVVPAFNLLDAVSKGTLDGGHGVLVYHYGKQTALALWGSSPAFGMDANMLLSWHKYGGGKELLQKIYASIGANVVSFPYGPMATQPLGWFKKPVTKVEDFKGLKFRTVGISIDMFTGLGAAVNALPGGEIVPALDRGLLDGAEFNNASSDRLLGFPDVSKVYMLQSFHQNAEQFEIMFNKDKFDALPVNMKAIIENAVEAASADMWWKSIDRYSKDYIELQTVDKVRIYKTPDEILQKQLDLFDDIMKKYSEQNPMFKEVLESQLAFATRAVSWEMDTIVDRRMAYNHYFGPKKAPAKKS
jgi:TRAP-type mannitol/chloroaromatic compound transport system substrate-binding protein